MSTRNPHYAALGFYDILEKLKEHALSEQARQALDTLSPTFREVDCRRKMAETTSARALLDHLGSPPLPFMAGLDEILTLAQAGGMLVPEQLESVCAFSDASRRMTTYLRRGEGLEEEVSLYGRGIEDISALNREIEPCIINGKVADDASSTLRHLRRKIDQVEGQIKEKLSHILQSRKEYLADGYITTRAGRYVLPVKRKYQSQFGGSVVEASGKGSTVFMEPTAIANLQRDLTTLSIEEDGEVRRILYTLSAAVSDYAEQIARNMDAMGRLDVLFAKAKLSAAMKAVPVDIGCARRIHIQNGRHPLLDAERCVPLTFQMTEDTNGVIITGPNTGGKTVTLKTVGLLSLMAQCGLHVTCDNGSYLAMHDGYWCDIGDSQSITQNLSTFSGHMTNVISIIEQASADSLVLLDELGSGTDPAEGMGIAIAVLEELRSRQCKFLVTTHYAQVKTYAENTPHVERARMAFDPETLQPLYRLEQGKSGESCALHIARRLGLAEHLLRRAHAEVYGGEAPSPSISMPAPKSRLVREVVKKELPDLAAKFAIGDSVTILPNQEIGIVYRPADDMGDVVVQVKGEKRIVKHNRLQLKVSAAELYPADYDFSIIFDTVEHRKAQNQMGRKYVPGLTIIHSEGEHISE